VGTKNNTIISLKNTGPYTIELEEGTDVKVKYNTGCPVCYITTPRNLKAFAFSKGIVSDNGGLGACPHKNCLR